LLSGNILLLIGRQSAVDLMEGGDVADQAASVRLMQMT
jgi:hypothetical protein